MLNTRYERLKTWKFIVLTACSSVNVFQGMELSQSLCILELEFLQAKLDYP